MGRVTGLFMLPVRARLGSCLLAFTQPSHSHFRRFGSDPAEGSFALSLPHKFNVAR